MPFEPKLRFLKIIWRVISFFLGGVCSIQLSYWDIFKIYAIFTARRNRTICRLGGGRSIQLSYGDNYEFSLILRGFSRSSQGPGLYSEAISIRRMAFLLMDFRPLKAVFEKLFLFPMLEKRLNPDAIRTKAQIFKNHLARDILFLRRRVLYPAELLRHF